MKQKTEPKYNISELKEETSLVNSLYAVAMEDLEASKILYEHKKYRHSIFFLQQSIEKATKSLSLHLNVIKENELKGEISHYPPEIYKRFIRVIETGFLDLIDQASIDPAFQKILTENSFDILPFKEEVNAKSEKLNNYINSFKGNHFLSEDEIMDVLFQLEEVENSTMENSEFIDKYLGEKEFPKHIRNINFFVNAFLFIIPADEKQIEECKSWLNNIIEKIHPLREPFEHLSHAIIALTSSGFLLFYLSLITAPHAMRARYPESKDNFNPEAFYNEELPLIKELDGILYFAERAIEEVGNFYDILLYFPDIAQNNISKLNIPKKSLKAGENLDEQ